MYIQVNSDMTDSMGPGKLVRHMQNPSYTYDGLSLSYANVYDNVMWTLRNRKHSIEVQCLIVIRNAQTERTMLSGRA